MSPGQFVVLHGMAGAGKSVLASESIRDVDMMINTFENNIFWLTIGQTNKDTLLIKMQVLFIYHHSSQWIKFQNHRLGIVRTIRQHCPTSFKR